MDDNNGKKNNTKYETKEDGTTTINNKEVFSKIKVEENYFENGKVINLKGKNQYYPNFIDVGGNQKEVFKEFIAAFSDLNKTEQYNCELCESGLLVKKDNLDNGIDNDQKEKFFSKISTLNMAHNKILGPSEKFPNSYWNFNSGLKICHFCTFLLIHHHLAFTKLSDGSEIFINAPSFKLMYELNKLVRELFGKTDVDSTKKREILAMSVIEYTRRLQTTLGQWNAMNIEIVIKKGDEIDFYTLPYETVNIISDRAIASILSDIGEFAIFDSVISGNYSFLQEISYKIIRASFKNESISAFIKMYKNQNNSILTAQKILKLYATIIDRRRLYARTK
ncbi:type I-B CRISPR-associated protein Cas8b1/Cst1 [Treponema sp. J25]|uniref:type I-B CRISPR-associated protein Cas8b1/Cst1 n=1 Tax=Treponema sp. J25 TaxID=2094121 RepID=UPI00105170D8|nr:type I-B CRISPR-associated protein Cas8b1/Cst1 [Treponema sp. J25]TCW62207.1 type I-B CRISPR-associated protein Cas8b1/Cst1 [Treponema sp. J25]